ncbi:AsmA family protein [Nitrogeniibacter aestuarii]|uniref:hypothetical protein n=1 Tax=Nitrogeniibacter aestuarii TaxID=2815343 RepID=UPI001E301DB7|nr:hypothetical protein [Nitrogeniibacter aestuarii]
MKRRHVAAAVLAVPLLVVVIGLFVVLAMPDWLDRMLARQVGNQITGELSFDLSTRALGAAPTLEAVNVHWRPANGEPGRIDVDRLVARSSWTAGPTGTRALTVDLIGGEVELHQRADGGWIFPERVAGPAGDPSTSAPFVTLDRLTLADVKLKLIPHDAPPIEGLVREGSIVASGDRWRIDLAGAGRREALGGDGQLTSGLHIEGEAIRLDEIGFHGEVGYGGTQIEVPQLTVGAIRLADGRFALTGLSGQVTLRHGAEAGTLSLSVSVPAIEGAPDAWSGRVGPVEARLEGAYASRLTLDEMAVSGDSAALRVTPLRAHLTATTPQGEVELRTGSGAVAYAIQEGVVAVDGLSLTAQVPDPARAGARVSVTAELTGTLMPDGPEAQGVVTAHAEGSTLNGALTYSAEASPPWRLDATVDQLDLDRWTPPPATDGDTEVALDVWRDWPVLLDLRVGRLTWQGMVARDAEVRLGDPE